MRLIVTSTRWRSGQLAAESLGACRAKAIESETTHLVRGAPLGGEVALDRVAVRESDQFLCGVQTSISRPISFPACLYRRGITVESPRVGGGFAPFPGQGERMAESTKTTISMITKALNALRICLCREPTAANTLSGERTLNLSFLGNSATRSAPIVLAGISMAGSLGCASINAFNRTTAAFLGIRARLIASCQGSTLSRANAERTLSPVPFRSSPIDAPRNSSNSGPMSGDSASWVISLPHPFHFAP